MWLTLAHKETIFLLLGALSLCTLPMVQGAYGQAPNVERVHAVGTNPMKLIMGLANVEYELRGAQHAGLQVFAEYQIGQWMEHPDLVMRSGVNYYISPTEQDLQGIFSGLNVGVSWSRYDIREDEGVFIGSGLGSRLVFGDRFYVSPRLVIHYLISQKKLLWGFEAPVGVLL